MGLSAATIERHIAEWEHRLSRPPYPHRAKWPSNLFHHTPLDNAVRILRDGELCSRIDSEGRRGRDVAAPGVIDNRHHGHNCARLYFRPRTPTQYHIEGIRKPGECEYGDAAHAPVLYMLVFDARAILSLDDVQFCDRNVQLGAAVIGNTEEYFAAIPFEKVFHMGDIQGDRSIIDHRCAEVLASSPMPLEGALKRIICRSQAEAQTLAFGLGNDFEKWRDKIIVSDDLRVFERRFAFFQEVSLSPQGISWTLNVRNDGRPINLSMRVTDPSGALVARYDHGEFPATWPPQRWLYKHALADGRYHVVATIEGHLAFQSDIDLGDTIF